jgi:4-amino-4-deoxy-L-arabinose transferase-like glycosyltransferase
MPTPTAWLAALGLIWLPGVGWSLMRDQTHTVMLNAAIAATWWALLRQIRAPSPMGFALLGVLMAWGVLSKYSYVLVAAAAVLAALSLPQPRRALLSRGWWLTPLITLALVAPHAAWMIRHWHSASASTLHKLQPPDTVSRLQGLGSGLGDLLVFVALAVLPWLLMARWAFGPPWRTLRAGCSSRIQREVCAAGRDEIRGVRRSDGHSHREDEQRSRSPDSADAHVAAIREEHSEGGDDQTLVLLKRYMALVLAPLLLMVLAGTSSFEGRWIQPLLLALPLLALAARPQAGLQPRAVKRFLCACVAMGVLLWTIVMSAPLLDAKRGKSDRLNWPVATIGQAMRAAGVDGQGVVIVGHHTLGGIVRMQFPEAQVVVCNIESKDTNACVRREAQRALAQGWRLTLAQADDPAPDPWWRAAWPADAAMPALHSVVLPYRWTDPKKQRLFLDVMPGPVPQAVAQGALACPRIHVVYMHYR